MLDNSEWDILIKKKFKNYLPLFAEESFVKSKEIFIITASTLRIISENNYILMQYEIIDYPYVLDFLYIIHTDNFLWCESIVINDKILLNDIENTSVKTIFTKLYEVVSTNLELRINILYINQIFSSIYYPVSSDKHDLYYLEKTRKLQIK